MRDRTVARGVIRKPERPPMRRVPWLLEAPDLGDYSDDEADLVKAIYWHGMWFIREGYTR